MLAVPVVAGLTIMSKPKRQLHHPRHQWRQEKKATMVNIAAKESRTVGGSTSSESSRALEAFESAVGATLA